MRTRTAERQVYLIIALVFSLLLSACGKNTNPNNSALVANAVGQYVWNGAVCVDRTTGLQVNSALCSQQTANGGFYLMNGYCYSATGQVVDVALCSAINNGTMGGQCFGYYLTQSNQYVLCNGANCSGSVMYSTTTGALTQCL